MDDHERMHFAFDPGARTVADATLRLLISFHPRPLSRLVEAFSRSLMDPDLLRALGYRQPWRMTSHISRTALRSRGRLERFLPPRRQPRFSRQLKTIRSYPDGYQVADLGTFPTRCPIPPA
jgi:hypothetical protein